jgi:hypothetical protein
MPPTRVRRPAAVVLVRPLRRPPMARSWTLRCGSRSLPTRRQNRLCRWENNHSRTHPTPLLQAQHAAVVLDPLAHSCTHTCTHADTHPPIHPSLNREPAHAPIHSTATSTTLTLLLAGARKAAVRHCAHQRNVQQHDRDDYGQGRQPSDVEVVRVCWVQRCQAINVFRGTDGCVTSITLLSSGDARPPARSCVYLLCVACVAVAKRAALPAVDTVQRI